MRDKAPGNKKSRLSSSPSRRGRRSSRLSESVHDDVDKEVDEH